MVSDLSAALLDLTSGEKGYTRARYAIKVDMSTSCSCCVCLVFC